MYTKLNKKSDKKVTFKDDTRYYITMTRNIYEEMMGYVNGFDTECSGSGIIERFEHKDKQGNLSVEFRVSEIFIPLQRNTATTTDIDEKEVASLVTRLVQEGKDTSKLRFHWHSHVNMDVFHSGTDEENYDDLQTGDWLVSLVANKHCDFLGRLDVYKPLRYTVSEIGVYLLEPSNTDIDTKVKANIERIKEYQEKSRVYVPQGNILTGFDRSYDDGYGGAVASNVYDTEDEDVAFTELQDSMETASAYGFFDLVYDKTTDDFVGFKSPLTGKMFRVDVDEILPYEHDDMVVRPAACSDEEDDDNTKGGKNAKRSGHK